MKRGFGRKVPIRCVQGSGQLVGLSDPVGGWKGPRRAMEMVVVESCRVKHESLLEET